MTALLPLDQIAQHQALAQGMKLSKSEKGKIMNQSNSTFTNKQQHAILSVLGYDFPSLTDPATKINIGELVRTFEEELAKSPTAPECIDELLLYGAELSGKGSECTLVFPNKNELTSTLTTLAQQMQIHPTVGEESVSLLVRALIQQKEDADLSDDNDEELDASPEVQLEPVAIDLGQLDEDDANELQDEIEDEIQEDYDGEFGGPEDEDEFGDDLFDIEAALEQRDMASLLPGDSNTLDFSQSLVIGFNMTRSKDFLDYSDQLSSFPIETLEGETKNFNICSPLSVGNSTNEEGYLKEPITELFSYLSTVASIPVVVFGDSTDRVNATHSFTVNLEAAMSNVMDSSHALLDGGFTLGLSDEDEDEMEEDEIEEMAYQLDAEPLLTWDSLYTVDTYSYHQRLDSSSTLSNVVSLINMRYPSIFDAPSMEKRAINLAKSIMNRAKRADLVIPTYVAFTFDSIEALQNAELQNLVTTLTVEQNFVPHNRLALAAQTQHTQPEDLGAVIAADLTSATSEDLDKLFSLGGDTILLKKVWEGLEDTEE